MQSNYKSIGDYIQLVDERNKDLAIDTLLGLTINKQFIPSVANTVGTDMRNYKIIRKNQFACSTMQVRRDKKMPVALLQEYEEAIISQAYPLFEVKNEKELLPEYLMMWFSRAEFDREACFHAVGGVRGSLEWEDFCNMKFPLPSPEKQSEIVKEYNTIKNRIALNNQLIQKLEETAQAIYKQWFIDFEFPDENGNPYKSSGGKMIWNEELYKEIPEDWGAGILSDIMEYSKERILLSELNEYTYISTENMIENRGGVTKASSLPSAVSVSRFKEDTILISNIRPYFKKIWLADFEGGCSNDILCIESKNNNPLFLYFVLEQDLFFEYVMAGSKGTKMPRGDKDWILQYPIVIPNGNQLKVFSEIVNALKKGISIRKETTKSLVRLSEIINSKMATIEN